MCSGRSSVSVIRSPRLRKANSCSRRDSVSKLQSTVSKIDPSGQNVVADPDAAVGQQGDLDRVGEPGQRLVHRVVHNLLDQVVQAALACGADVHAGSLAYGLEALENGDRACVVGQSFLTPPAGIVIA